MQRKKEAKQNEILKKEKQAKFEEETAAKFAQQQAKVDQRRKELEIRDKKRIAYMEEQRREQAMKNEQKRLEKD